MRRSLRVLCVVRVDRAEEAATRAARGRLWYHRPMRHLWFIVPLILCVAGGARANIGSFGDNGAGLVPLASKEIELVSERVHIGMRGRDRVTVDSTFVLRNTAAGSRKVQVGFPFFAWKSKLVMGRVAVPNGLSENRAGHMAWRFKARVRGRPVKPALRPLEATMERSILRGPHVAYLWGVTFSPGEEVTVRCTYITGITPGAEPAIDRVRYNLRAGTLWKGGATGRARLVFAPGRPFRTCDRFDDEIMTFAGSFPPMVRKNRPYPGGSSQAGAGKKMKLVWDLRDFKPGYDLTICFHDADKFRTLYRQKIAWEAKEAAQLDAAARARLRRDYLATRGQVFKDRALGKVYANKWWYEPDRTFSRKKLTPDEAAVMGALEGRKLGRGAGKQKR